MNSAKIDILQEEALAIVELEKVLLKQMLDTGLLEQADQKAEKTLDQDSALKYIEVLNGEAHKLQQLEMVLAVVGTMKAGKSTTINAIVGVEILPNRNAPMTAIPTLIRHTKGQKQPKLIFTEQAQAPLNQLIKNLDKNIKANAKAVQKLKNDEDLYPLIERIQRKEKIINQADGAEEIFEFLKSINDLVRIAPEFNLEFPFDKYKEVDQLPIIDIEFSHLKELEDKKGRLILLDTPGPNEEGQADRLLNMLEDQLKKASAVIAVVDYTQFKSEAEAKVIKQLVKIAETAKDRIYALVNKFDNNDRNGLDENAVKKLVENLTEKLIEQNRVYPVSARYGYLANCAKHELLEDGSLPSSEKFPWVEDFYDAAGLRRESRRTPENIADGIEDLWSDSKFSEPLEGIIKTAHDNAAIITVQSAVDKLSDLADKINNVLELRGQGLDADPQKLNKLIKDLDHSLNQIKNAEREAEASLKKDRDDFAKGLNTILNNKFSEIQGKLDKEVLNANMIVDGLKADEHKPVKRDSGLGKLLFGIVKSVTDEVRRNVKIEKNSEVINFGDHKEQALEFVKGISNLIDVESKNMNADIEKQLKTLLDKFEHNFQHNIIVKANDELKKLASHLQETGFKGLNFNLPPRKNLALNLSPARLMNNALIESEATKTGKREKTGMFSGVSRWFGSKLNNDWGYEEYDYKVKEYKIDMKVIKNEVSQNFVNNKTALNQSINKDINIPLQNTSSQFFAAFSETVKHLSGDIEQSKKDKEKSKLEQDQLRAKIEGVQQPTKDVLERLEELKKGCEAEYKQKAVI